MTLPTLGASPSPLQRSHARESVETRNGSYWPVSTSSFNEATLVRAWRPQALALEGEEGGFSSAPLVATPKAESRDRPCHPRGDLV